MSITAEIIDIASQKGILIATAESCTGGMVAVALTDTPGSSAAIEGGFVTYSNAAKSRMLGVNPALIDQYGAVSEPVAAAMADGVILKTRATMAVSITGIAGPGGSEFKPEGRVCFGLAQSGHVTQAHTIEFGALGRPNVRQAACDYALSHLHTALKKAVQI